MKQITNINELLGKTIRSVYLGDIDHSGEVVLVLGFKGLDENCCINFESNGSFDICIGDEISPKAQAKAGLMVDDPDYIEYLRLKERFE